MPATNGLISSAFSSGEGLFLHGNKHSINVDSSGWATFYLQTEGIYLTVSGVGEYDYSTGTVKASWNGNSIAADQNFGIFEVASGYLTITDSVFYNNNAADGGAVASMTSGVTKINNSVFISNTASNSDGKGAALYQNNDNILLIADSLFKTNTAGGNAGAIASVGTTSTLAITGSTFDGNTAGSNGGAIYSAGTTNIYLSLIHI